MKHKSKKKTKGLISRTRSHGIAQNEFFKCNEPDLNGSSKNFSKFNGKMGQENVSF